MGEGIQRCRVAAWGKGWRGGYIGVLPSPNWDGGEWWKETVHMPSCVTYVTEEYSMFVKWALIYLTVSIIRRRRDKVVAGREEGGATGDRAR